MEPEAECEALKKRPKYCNKQNIFEFKEKSYEVHLSHGSNFQY